MYNVGADGDRQVFPIAWKALQRPYHLVGTAPASAGYRAEASTGTGATNPQQQGRTAARGLWCGATELQHDLRGRPLFLHRSMDKLNKRAVRSAGAAEDAPRVTPWKTVYHWSNHEVGVWGETRLEYGCSPRSTLWLAGCVTHFFTRSPPPLPPPLLLLCESRQVDESMLDCCRRNTSDADFVDYFGGTEWARSLNTIVEDALDHLPAY